MYYLTNKVNTEKINDIFSEFKKAVTLEHKEDIMTIAERLEQRGIEKGKEAGIQIGRQEGKEAGIQIGEQRGEKKGIKNVALNMISKDIDAKLIAEFTGMTVEEIDELKGN